MADEAENIRKQIRFLSGLIANANKSRNQQESSERQIPTRVVNPHKPSHVNLPGKSRSFHQNKNDRETSSKYCWNTYSSLPVFHSSSIIGTIGKVKPENEVNGGVRPNNKAACQLQQTSKYLLPPSASKVDTTKQKMLINSKAVTYPFHTCQGVSESNLPSEIVHKPKPVTSNLENTVQYSNVIKGTREVNVAAVSVIQTVSKPIYERTVKATTSIVTESDSKVDVKLKTLSNSLKEELKKTEEQINLLKKNLTEQKMLQKHKQELKEPKCLDAVKQNVGGQTLGTLGGQDLLNVKGSSIKQTKSITSSPVTKVAIPHQGNVSPFRQPKNETSSSLTKLHVDSVDAYPSRLVKSDSFSPVGFPIAKSPSQDNFISKSPYKLVKCNSSPVVSVGACQKLDLNKHVQEMMHTKQLKTKYNNQNRKSFSENKGLTKNVIGSKDNRVQYRNNSVFKKTKYTLRRIKSEPGSAQKRAKTPTKFLKSRYSLKRVRRSLSNKSNKELAGKSRYGTPNAAKSHSQSVARGIKSKYKINNIASPKIIKPKQHYNVPVNVSSQVYNSYGKRHWKSSLHPHIFRSSRKFYYMPVSRWAQRQGYRGNTGWPIQYLKVTRYLTPAYSANRRFYHSTGRYSRQKGLIELKKKVPFNPKLRTDHRQRTGEKLKMINGAVYRSSQRKLVKASPSGAGGSALAKQRQLTKNPMKFTRGRRSVESSKVNNSETKDGTLIQQSSLKTRLVAAQLMNKSIAMATAKYKKDNTKTQRKKKYCMFYNRFGKCNRKDNCSFIHDPDRIAVCTRFLRGTCKVKDCPFSHKVSKEKMPVCSYFLRGKCTRDDCPYLHVNVNRDAEICEDFVNGYCPLGDQCKKKHTLLCPVFAQTGSCPSGNKCKLQHRKTRKRKVSQSDDAEPVGKQMRHDSNSSATTTSNKNVCNITSAPPSILKTWTRLAPVVGGEKSPLVLDSSDEESDDLAVPFKDRKLPTYIPLIVKDKVKVDETESGSEGPKDAERTTTMKIRPHL